MRAWCFVAGLVVLAACGDEGSSRSSDQPSGDGGTAGDDLLEGGTPQYSCAAPAWDDPNWVAKSGCYYVFDAKALFFNDWCYRVSNSACKAGAPPPGKSIDDMVDAHDRLAFLTSLQGLVNRDRPTLYLVAEDKPDEEWLRLLGAGNSWLTQLRRTDVSTVDQVLTLFAKHPAIAGSTRWVHTESYGMSIAFSLAGAENLVVVRGGSAIEAAVTQSFPVKQDLERRFASKRAAYDWVIDEYLATGKLAPSLALFSDGFAIAQAKAGVFDAHGHNVIPRDFPVANKQLMVSYGVHPLSPDPTQPSAPVGEGREVLTKALTVIRRLVGPNKVFEVGGWPPSTYEFDCNGDGVINGSDHVRCDEWEWIELVSKHGGVERMGMTSAYAKEAANTTFFKHGLGVDLLVQPPPMSPARLLRARHVSGPPRDFSFEEEGASAWTFTATNRAVYVDANKAKDGKRFLQLNVAPADVGKGFHQDVVLPLARGQHYRFMVHGRSTSAAGPAVSGRLRVTVNGATTTLCERAFEIDNDTWRPLTCDFHVTAPGLANPRLEVMADTPALNYAFDEAYLLGSVTMEPNLARRYAMVYLGDYDFSNALTIIPIGVHPYPWTTRQESTIPIGWSLTADAAVEVPPIFAYFVRTRTDRQTFVMPDSGAGYLNPGLLPDAVLDDWVSQTTGRQRPYSLRTGWVLNGTRPADVVADNAAGTKIRALYRKIAPEGVLYAGHTQDARSLESGLAVLPMEGGHLAAGMSTANSASGLQDAFNRSASPFNVFRSVYLSEKGVDAAFTELRARGVDVHVLDPVTFMYLFRQSQGQGTANRMSVVAHDIPSVLKAGSTVTVHLSVRNDGWDTWTSKPSSGVSCDGTATAGRACERLAWGLAADAVATGIGAAPSFPYPNRVELSAPVFAGDVVKVTFRLTAPTAPGAYTFQVDGVKELIRYFETAGNVPWQKHVVVE